MTKKHSVHPFILLLLAVLGFTACSRGENVKIYPAPEEEILYKGYSVRVNGEEVPVYRARVSAVPLNWRWPGYQRPLYQTELAGFCSWDMAAPVTVEVIPRHVDSIEQVAVRPRSMGIDPEISGQSVIFSLDQPARLTVEVNGMHHALHLFANPVEDPPPSPDDPDVLYFGPGIHDIGKVDLEAGQTVYIAGGAVVYGAFEARDAPGLTIRGRGILDGSRILRPDSMLSEMPDIPFGTMALYGCDHARIEGITFRDANVYVLMPVACRDLSIRNIKQIGMWRYNTDGIHLKNCQDVTVEDCFVRNFDDCLVVNGFPVHRGYECGDLPMKNASFSRCVIWNDWDMAIRIGVVCYAPVIENIVFQDCDIIHASIAALNIDNHGHALVRDIRFEDIRIEMDDGSPKPVLQREAGQVYADPSGGTHVPLLALIQVTKSFYARTEKYGKIQDVLLKDIRVTGDRPPGSVVRGHSPEYGVSNLVIENLRFGDRPVRNLEEARFEIGDFVSGVTLRP
jgi:hypothetical protein